MTRWEEAFTKKREKDETPTHEEEFATKKELTQEAPKTPAPPEEQKRPPSYRKRPQKKPRQAYPAILERMHNFLDDIWINILLRAKEKPDTLLLCGATRGEGCLFTSFSS